MANEVKAIYESQLPKVVKIINNLPTPPVNDEGTVDVNDLSKCSCDERVWNTGLNCVRGERAVICDDTLFALPELKKNEIPVIVYGNRGERFILKPGEQVNLTAETDEQVKFYIDQFSPVKGVVVQVPGSGDTTVTYPEGATVAAEAADGGAETPTGEKEPEIPAE